MSFPYKKILVIGATSGPQAPQGSSAASLPCPSTAQLLTSTGIGQALATRFIRDGHNVIASGRRQDRLEALLQEHGSEKLSIAAVDIAKIHAVPGFAAE